VVSAFLALTDHFTGLNITSGIQTQVWTVDMIQTALRLELTL
jgi:hypothetical protein